MNNGKIKAILIDLSGTLHIDDEPTPNAIEALERLVLYNINLYTIFSMNGH